MKKGADDQIPIIHLDFHEKAKNEHSKQEMREKISRLQLNSSDFLVIWNKDQDQDQIRKFKRTQRYEDYLNSFLFQEKTDLEGFEPKRTSEYVPNALVKQAVKGSRPLTSRTPHKKFGEYKEILFEKVRRAVLMSSNEKEVMAQNLQYASMLPKQEELEIAKILIEKLEKRENIALSATVQFLCKCGHMNLVSKLTQESIIDIATATPLDSDKIGVLVACCSYDPDSFLPSVTRSLIFDDLTRFMEEGRDDRIELVAKLFRLFDKQYLTSFSEICHSKKLVEILNAKSSQIAPTIVPIIQSVRPNSAPQKKLLLSLRNPRYEQRVSRSKIMFLRNHERENKGELQSKHPVIKKRKPRPPPLSLSHINTLTQEKTLSPSIEADLIRESVRARLSSTLGAQFKSPRDSYNQQPSPQAFLTEIQDTVLPVSQNNNQEFRKENELELDAKGLDPSNPFFSNILEHHDDRRPMPILPVFKEHLQKKVIIKHVEQSSGGALDSFQPSQSQETPAPLQEKKNTINIRGSSTLQEINDKRPQSTPPQNIMLPESPRAYKSLCDKEQMPFTELLHLNFGKDALGSRNTKAFLGKVYDYTVNVERSAKLPEEMTRNEQNLQKLKSSVRKHGKSTRTQVMRFPNEEIDNSNFAIMESKLQSVILETEPEQLDTLQLFPMVQLRKKELLQEPNTNPLQPPLKYRRISAIQVPLQRSISLTRFLTKHNQPIDSKKQREKQKEYYKTLDTAIDDLTSRIKQLSLISDLEKSIGENVGNLEGEFNVWRMAFERNGGEKEPESCCTSPSKTNRAHVTQQTDSETSENCIKNKIVNSATFIKKTSQWKQDFFSLQVALQSKLLKHLEARDQDKQVTFKSPNMIRAIGRTALTAARTWQLRRSIPRCPVKLAPDTSQPLSEVLECNIWRKARIEIEEKNERLYNAVLFFHRLMVYLEMIQAPTEHALLEFLNIFRDKIVLNASISIPVYWDSLQQFKIRHPNGLGLMEGSEGIKVMHFIRNELKISAHNFIEGLESQQWQLTDELKDLKKSVLQAERKKHEKNIMIDPHYQHPVQ